jgi:hypothetical protein
VGVRIAFAVLAIALSWTGPSLAQTSQTTTPTAPPQIYTSFTPDELANILRNAGYRAEVVHKGNNYSIRTAMAGYNVDVYLYCNTEVKCTSVDWDMAFVASPQYTLQLANAWNREKRFAKAYIAADGGFFIEYTVEFSGGVTAEAFAQSARRFDSLCGDWSTFPKQSK